MSELTYMTGDTKPSWQNTTITTQDHDRSRPSFCNRSLYQWSNGTESRQVNLAEHEPKRGPSAAEIMTQRYNKLLEKKLPAFDLLDLKAQVGLYKRFNRQSAPEYSQRIYTHILQTECAIGDYLEFNKNSHFTMTAAAREQIVALIENLQQKKQYKLETLYLAVSIADRYLVNLAISDQAAPNLVNLAVVATLIAAKIE